MTSLISISGKIGSGKDLTGKIIQAFLEFPLASNENILRIAFSGIDNPQSQIKKWADKLKDIICILLNCTREQLEDRDFKEKELGKEWWYWKLERDGGYSTLLLSYSETTGTENFELIKLTPRLLLQLLGTDCGRNIIHPNIWVNSLMSEYVDKSEKRTCSETGMPILATWQENYPNWIITDTRFLNELEAIKKRNGISIRIEKPKKREMFLMNANIIIDTRKVEHESETALDNVKFDYTIVNNGTIEELIEKVKEILIKEKII